MPCISPYDLVLKYRCQLLGPSCVSITFVSALPIGVLITALLCRAFELNSKVGAVFGIMVIIKEPNDWKRVSRRETDGSDIVRTFSSALADYKTKQPDGKFANWEIAG